MVKIGIAPDSWGIWFAGKPNQVPWYRFLDEVNTPAQIPPERWDHETRDRFSRNIVDLADLAAKLEVALCLETLGIPMGTVEECAALLQRLDHPALRINYDPAALRPEPTGAAGGWNRSLPG